MSAATQLASTGMLMGFIHVLAGPDHLSALATLSGTNIRSGKEKKCESFLLGLKWGLGHAVGLIIVGEVLISLEQSSEISVNAAVSTMLEGFVGVFMITLGFYGMHKAFKHRSNDAVSQFQQYPSTDDLEMMVEKMHEDHDDISNRRCPIVNEMTRVLDEDSLHASRVHEMDSTEIEDEDDSESRNFKATRAIGMNRTTDAGKGFMKRMASVELSSSLRSVSNVESSSISKSPSALQLERDAQQEQLLDDFGGSDSSKAESAADVNLSSTFSVCTPGALAVVTGLVHGVAGPGGVLGIIPAVQLRDPYLASIYLGTFCVSSCLVMGGFAAFYGSFSKWLAGEGRVFLVEVGSASLSLLVGLLWIVLLSVGKLEDLFP